MLTNPAFAHALLAGMPTGAAGTLHSFVGDPGKNARGQWRAIVWAGGDVRFPALNPFANNYICVSSFYANAEGKYHRRKIQFAALHAVMIDDLGTKLPMSDLRLAPSCMIETSPGNYQAWLLLEAPILSLRLAEVLIDQMVSAGISAQMDPGMRGVTRVARLPEGCNRKPKNLDAAGRAWKHVVREVALDRRYSPAEIAQAYELDLTLKAAPTTRARPRTGIDLERTGLLDWIKTLGLYQAEQRESYHQITCPWADQHSDGSTTGTYYMEPLETNCWQGGFVCNHGHCIERDINDLVAWVRAKKAEYADEDIIPPHLLNYLGDGCDN
jgi:hypothetical protein